MIAEPCQPHRGPASSCPASGRLRLGRAEPPGLVLLVRCGEVSGRWGSSGARALGSDCRTTYPGCSPGKCIAGTPCSTRTTLEVKNRPDGGGDWMRRRGGPTPYLRLDLGVKVDQATQVHRLHGDGATFAQIAERTGLSLTTCWRRFWWYRDWSEPAKVARPIRRVPPQRGTAACPRGASVHSGGGSSGDPRRSPATLLCPPQVRRGRLRLLGDAGAAGVPDARWCLAAGSSGRSPAGCRGEAASGGWILVARAVLTLGRDSGQRP
jgi:hypothetical protein